MATTILALVLIHIVVSAILVRWNNKVTWAIFWIEYLVFIGIGTLVLLADVAEREAGLLAVFCWVGPAWLGFFLLCSVEEIMDGYANKKVDQYKFEHSQILDALRNRHMKKLQDRCQHGEKGELIVRKFFNANNN